MGFCYAEDLLPRLLAMQRSAGLPAAAAGSAQHASLPGEQQHPGSSGVAQRAAEAAQLPQRPKRSWSEGPGDAPHAEDAQKPLRLRLINGLDRLRALTAQHAQRGEQEEPQRQQQQRQQQQPASLQPGEEPHPEEHISSNGSTLQALASTASRFLPIYVPFGGQHHLPALPGAARPPARADTEAEEGLDILAALQQQEALERRQQDERQEAQQQQQQQQEEAQEGQAPVLPPEGGPDQGQREAQGGEEGAGGAAAARRSAAYLLSHHRMYAIRERAAAACAAAAKLGGAAAHRAGVRPAVQLSDDVAPRLSISTATARLAPVPPHMEPLDRASPNQDRGGCVP